MITTSDIKKYVTEHQDEALQCFAEAIQSPSPTGFEHPMAVTMEGWMKKAGLDIKTYTYAKDVNGFDRPNFIGDWNGTRAGMPGSKKFLFNGHMDTFPATDSDEKGYDAFSGKIKDGKIYGRGASDMKGGDCAAMMAVKFLKDMGFDPNGTITLNFVSDEENGAKYGVISMLNDGLLKADFGISMEPTDNKMKIGHGAIYPCKITVYGDGGSASVPIVPDDKENVYGCEDAIQKAMKAVAALHKLQDEVLAKKETKFGTHLAVTKINAGDAVNTYPRVCEICIDRRFSSPETVESVDKEICDALDAVKLSDPTFKYKFEGFYEPMTPEFTADVNSDVAKAIDGACVEILGHESEKFTMPGGSDMAFIHDKYGFETPWFGPGHNEGIACSYENCKIDNYINCIMVYMKTLVTLMA